MLVMHQKSS